MPPAYTAVVMATWKQVLSTVCQLFLDMRMELQGGGKIHPFLSQAVPLWIRINTHTHTHSLTLDEHLRTDAHTLPVVEDVCEDDGEEAQQQSRGAGIHHRVEDPHRHQGRVGEVRHLGRSPRMNSEELNKVHLNSDTYAREEGT